MRFDLEGRLRNMRLPDGKAAILYSVYEAVSNGYQAIEERLGDKTFSDGRIDIEVKLTKEEKLIERIIITDNGIGLNDRNLVAFDTCDSRNKLDRGGKGIGRLIWLKAFGRVHVRSVYLEDGKAKGVSFDFILDQNDSLHALTKFDAKLSEIGTQITLSSIQPSANVKVKPDVFLRDIALHFFSYFIAKAMPKLTIYFGDRDPIELTEYINERTENPSEETITVNGLENCTLTISHLYVEKTLSRQLRNSILFTANQRLVENIEIERKYALNELENEKAYIALVRGQFLDERVDQERTGFKLTGEQHDILLDAVMHRVEAFLDNHITEIRKTQKIVVKALLNEHPQLAVKVKNVDEYVSNLPPSMGDEDIGKSLFTLLYRDERKIAKEVTRVSETESLSDEARDQAQEILAKVTEQAKSRLAEYVVKRRQILELAKSFLRYKGDGSGGYHLERTIHDLICPMGNFYAPEDYESHNLWVIDDLLAYYQFFGSDKSIKKIVDDSEDKDEPDLIFFNPMGFRRAGTNDPIVLVEFKRPGDEHMSKDPVDQILGYIEKLKGKTARAADGEVLSEIRDSTPFECYVVCDLTESARRLLARSQAPYETPDGEGYFGFAPNHKAVIHVLSYKKMLKDAELRNRIFFEKLGLA